jgi:hypothetical protein
LGWFFILGRVVIFSVTRDEFRELLTTQVER